MEIVKENDVIVLLSDSNRKILLKIEDITKKIKRLGIYNPISLVGKNYGSTIEITGIKYVILKPSIVDKIECIKRKSQIIIPKDISTILLYCDIKSGDNIVECGFGSGALTMALANAVMPIGRVITYEKRKDFAEFAKKNIIAAGYEKYIEIKIRDVIIEKLDEKDADAVILDIPNPWDCIKNVYDVLKICGHYCAYIPTINQVEKTVISLRQENFFVTSIFENIQRKIVVGKGGTRPDFNMLGHTGYLIFARKILEKI